MGSIQEINHKLSERQDTKSSVAGIELTAVQNAVTASDVDESILQIHAHSLRHLREAQRNLLGIHHADALISYLLQEFPATFGFSGAELRLHDPESELAALVSPILPARHLDHSLTLLKDSYSLYQLYPEGLDTELIDLDDPRMFKILAGAGAATGAVMVPLTDGNHLTGSYHLAMAEGMVKIAGHDRDLFSMLGQLVAVALRRVVEQHKIARFTLLDSVTELGNRRAFRRDMLREVHWARRAKQPVTLLFLALDEFDELRKTYGEVASNFVQWRVSQRLSAAVRATDYLALVADGRFSVLLPSCNEPQAHAIGERLCRDIDELSVDDGRGAVFHVSLSIGLVCWEPAKLPMKSSERLASQIESEAEAAMHKAELEGGNTVSVARLGLLMV